MDCGICTKKVYFAEEKMEINGRRFHKHCFKCIERGCRLTIANFHLHEGTLFCPKHVPKLHRVVHHSRNTRIPHCHID